MLDQFRTWNGDRPPSMDLIVFGPALFFERFWYMNIGTNNSILPIVTGQANNFR